MLLQLEETYPNFVNVISIGQSVLGKDIWCIKITNKNTTNPKLTCLIDGCIHGCEWEAGEACLYLADYLLINFKGNRTVRDILNSTEIFIVPLVNPDGRQRDYRFNANGIDLNRNFNIDFGRLLGGSMPLGVLFNRFKIPYREFPRLSKWFPNFPPYLTNSGRQPFSEPETQAIRDLAERLNARSFSFYLTCHTAAHCIIGPWVAYKPPKAISTHDLEIMTLIEQWIVANTEYTSYRVGERVIYEGEEHYASGVSADWFYATYHIPSFCFEILSEEYEMWMGTGKHDHLVHWMQTTLPVFLYYLVNIEQLKHWEIPHIQPPLPEGVPPIPI